MQSIWLLLAIVSASPEIGDGSLIFLENCNSVVQIATRDEIGHVALAFRDGKETWIYEATPGHVRRVTLADYEQELARINARKRDPIRMWVLTPERKFSPGEITAMREYLDEQLGRRYSIRNYVKSKPGDGTHCAELAANTLNRSGCFDLAESYTIHPAKLMSIVEPEFRTKVEYPIGKPAVVDAWYVRWGRCCSETCNWCGWSCGEVWSFCW